MKKLKYFVIILAIIAGIFLISSKVQAVELVEDDTTAESTGDGQGTDDSQGGQDTGGEETDNSEGEQEPGNSEGTEDDNTGDTSQEQQITWTDPSKINISLERESIIEFYHVRLNISGLKEENRYHIYIANSNTAPNVEISETTGRINNADLLITGSTSDKNFSVDKFVAKSGDIYVWMYEEQYNEVEGKYISKCIVSGMKLQKPEQNKLGLRMKCYFFSEYTSSFIYEPRENDNVKINLKIGTITDNKILRSIQKGESDGLSKLLNYAKNAKSPMYTGAIKLGNKEPSITGNMNLVNGHYYYVYMTLDDENGTYYPIEDVSLYQALVDSKVGNNLFDYLDDNFKWNINDDEPSESEDREPDVEDDTTAPGKIPQTGVNAVVIISMIGIAIIATIIAARQYKKYNIKY